MMSLFSVSIIHVPAGEMGPTSEAFVIVVSLAGGLEDVGNLLRLIGAAPFDTTYTFRKAIHEPFHASATAAAAALQDQHQQCVMPATPQYRRRHRDGVRRLLSLLQPLMWRSNKEAAAADHPLPPR